MTIGRLPTTVAAVTSGNLACSFPGLQQVLYVSPTRSFGLVIAGKAPHIVLCVLVLGLAAPSLFAMPIVELREGGQIVPSLEHLEAAPDDGLEQVRERAFVPLGAGTPNFGYSARAHWFRFGVRAGPPQERWFLEVAHPPLDFVDFYLVRSRAETIHERAGDLVFVSPGGFHGPHPLFALPLTGGEEATIYLWVASSTVVTAPILLRSEYVLIESYSSGFFVAGLYYGTFVVMIVYNLFLFFSTRYRSYLYYVFYLAAFASYVFALDGLTLVYLWPDCLLWNNQAAVVFLMAALLMALIFAAAFLRTRLLLPRIHRPLRIFIALLMLGVAASFVMPVPVGIKVGNLLTFVVCLLMIGLGIGALRAGWRPARLFLLAWVLLLVGSMVFALRSWGLLPDNAITLNGFRVGSLLEMVALSFALGDRLNHLSRQKQEAEAELHRSQIQMLESFARFVPREFMRMLGKEDFRQMERGQAVRKSLIVMFCDIRNFTPIAERMDALVLFRFLNDYFESISAVIREHGGFIDKFIGDAIMAIFPDEPNRAVAAAREMIRALDDFNARKASADWPPIRIGVALHGGAAVLGTLGAADRVQTTVIGDTVNIAARLEELTKTYGVNILISAPLASALKPPPDELRSLGEVEIRGRSASMGVFGL